MITIPQNVMRAGMIAGFAIGGIVVERLAILSYKLAAPAVKRLYDRATKSSRPFTIVPRRSRKPKPVAPKSPVNGHGGHKKGPKIVPPAVA
jgi:hypothetical protein